MKWSRELRIARRSVRTALKAASAMAASKVAAPLHPTPLSAQHATLFEMEDFGPSEIMEREAHLRADLARKK